MFKIKLDNGEFAALDQVSDFSVDVYPTVIEGATYFEEFEDAEKIAKLINESNVNFHCEQKAVSIVECEIITKNEIKL